MTAGRTAIGLFGGTFNPVHRGHLEPVIEVKQQLGLAGVHLVPVNVPSHREAPGVSAEDRLEMLRLAIGASTEPGLLADDREIQRGGASYSIDTLAELRDLYGREHALVLILGLDAFLLLESWHRFDELFNFAHVAVMERPGSQLPASLPGWWSQRKTDDAADIFSAPAGHIVHMDITELDISSTAIRHKLQNGESPDAWMHAPVLRHISDNKLYGADELKSAPSPSGHQTSEAAEPKDKKKQTGASEEVPSPDHISKLVVEAMDDVKARDIRCLDVRGMTDFTDFMVIATGTSDRHLSAVAENVRNELKATGINAIGSEGDDGGEWVLIDLGSVVAHVMRQETREFYDLDGLWSEDMRELMQAQRDGNISESRDS